MRNKFLLIASSVFLWIYWWILAITLISLVIIISFIVSKKFHQNLVSFLCKTLTYALFKPRLIYKTKNISFPVIYVANHVSFFDLFICGAVLPDQPRGLELSEHFKKPFYGWFLTRFGQIPISIGNRRSLIESFNKIIDKLKNKERSILVMPEGHRTRDGKVGEFKSGAFFLSRKSGVPVVPVVFKGLYEKAKKGFIIKPGKFDVIIMDPVFPDSFDSDDKMAKKVKEIISNELNR